MTKLLGQCSSTAWAGLTGSLGHEGWKQLIPCLNFGIFNRPEKNSNSTQFIQGFQSIKAMQLVGQKAEFKFESKFEPLPVIWQSLLKAIPEDNRRF